MPGPCGSGGCSCTGTGAQSGAGVAAGDGGQAEPAAFTLSLTCDRREGKDGGHRGAGQEGKGLSGDTKPAPSPSTPDRHPRTARAAQLQQRHRGHQPRGSEALPQSRPGSQPPGLGVVWFVRCHEALAPPCPLHPICPTATRVLPQHPEHKPSRGCATGVG